MSLLALTLLVGALALSPYRYFLLPAALVVLMAFARLKDPQLGILTLIPYAPIFNLEGYLTDGSLYPSEVVLLAALSVMGFRRPRALRPEGAGWIALALAVWIAIAALAGSGLTDTVRVARLLRTALLGAGAFVLARHAARRSGGASAWIDAATGAAGIFALLALGEALIHRGGGLPHMGSAVGGSELLAIHLTLLVPGGLALAALGVDRSRWTWLLLALAGMALIGSFSRSGWLGAWAAILGMGLLGHKLARKAGRRLLGAAIIVLVVGVASGIGLSVAGGVLGEYGGRLRSIADPQALVGDRLADWEKGIRTIAEYPLFGHPDAPNPYNLGLGLAAVSGIPALAAFAFLVVASWRSGRLALRQPESAVLAVGLMSAVIAFLVTGVGESSLGARVTPAAMATLGLLSGMGGGAGAGSTALPARPLIHSSRGGGR